MSLISVSDLSRAYGPVDIFSGLSFTLAAGTRAAIVGPNGVGKTSLLRILAGEEAPTSGSVHKARGMTLGYLPQEAGFEAHHTLWEECMTAFRELQAEENALVALEAKLGETPQDAALLEQYGTRQAEFELAGGYSYETRINQTLGGLGFSKEDHQLGLQQLSGGQRTRALLARLLLQAPDLLVLDEPTNHLDIAAVEFLESYLRDWDGTVLVVSHDRYFLDKVVGVIWEMRPGGFEMYRGNYSAYLKQRQLRWEDRKQYVGSEIARMEKDLDYIRKNIAGQRTQQAKGKLSRLSREIEAIEKHGFEGVRGKQWGEIGSRGRPMRVEEAAKRLSSLQAPQDGPIHLGLEMRAAQRSGDIVLRAKDLQVGYPTKNLLRVDKLELMRGDCAALIGPNGSGKTTLVRSILGSHPPLGGEISLGASLDVAYFAQGHEDLDANLTLIEEIDKAAPAMLESEIRSYLGRFMFSGDEQRKKVGVLSGGERGRLALAKLALVQANLLLLDEPSNHLDIPSQEILQQVLAEYQGTILMVSHDRYLIAALATQIWEINPAEGTLDVFKGTFAEYKASQEAKKTNKVEKPKASQGQGSQQERGKDLSKHEQQRREQRIKELESEIAEKEQRLAELGGELENPPADPDEVRRLSEAYAQVQTELEQVMGDWEAYHE